MKRSQCLARWTSGTDATNVGYSWFDSTAGRQVFNKGCVTEVPNFGCLVRLQVKTRSVRESALRGILTQSIAGVMTRGCSGPWPVGYAEGNQAVEAHLEVRRFGKAEVIGSTPIIGSSGWLFAARDSSGSQESLGHPHMPLPGDPVPPLLRVARTLDSFQGRL